MPNCAFVHCTNRRVSGCGKTFHKFPFSKPTVLEQWIVNMKQDEWKPSKYSVLCSDHFDECCFDRTGQTTRIRANAVPTIFEWKRSKYSLLCSDHLTSPCSAHSDEYWFAKTGQTTGVIANTVPTMVDSLVNIQKCTQKRESTEADFPLDDLKRPNISSLKTDHSYFTRESPQSIKHKLNFACDKIYNMKRKIKSKQQKTRRLQKKVSSLKNIIEAIQKKKLISDNGAELLLNQFSDIPSEVIKRMLKNKARGKITRETYPPELRAFALTLQFYSTKAYRYVRKTFDCGLPHPSAIRKWYSAINGEPGFTQESFSALQLKVQQATSENTDVLCALMIDEMAIRKHVSWEGESLRGYVDIGTGVSDDCSPVATDALVFMVVSLKGHWKLPVGYFLIKGMSGEERANLVLQCICKLSDVGVHIVSLTCDGPSCHLTMLTTLGANMHVPDLDPSFPHPITPSHRVSVLLDVCHMLKLLRNTLAEKGIIVNGSGQHIKWSYIEELHKLQQEEGLRAGNKLRSAHIEWRKQKMKVNLAAQTLSSSVADALEFCNNDLKLSKFQGCEATVEFIRKFDRLFDIMNSRNPLARNYKAPMHLCNENKWRPFFTDMYLYITSLKNMEGKNMYQTPKKTAFIGFLVGIKSLEKIYDSLVRCEERKLKYLLTYKLSQDHLELFFCAVRSAGGFNNNPTSGQFTSAYKRLIIHHEVEGIGGNCIAQDNTSILHVSSVFSKPEIDHYEQDIHLIRKYNLESRSPSDDEHDYADIPNLWPLSLYKREVIAYISGYVIRMTSKRIPCPECVSVLTTNTSSKEGSLLHRKNRGGLLTPSSDVLYICEVTEQFIQRMLKTTNGALPQSKGINLALTTAVLGEVAPNGVFDELYEHTLDGSPDCNHVFILIKCLAACYIKIRMHHLCKQFNAEITGPKIRKQFTKLVLFKHQ